MGESCGLWGLGFRTYIAEAFLEGFGVQDEGVWVSVLVGFRVFGGFWGGFVKGSARGLAGGLGCGVSATGFKA